MSGPSPEDEPAFHLFLDPPEVPVVAHALRLLISDEHREQVIRNLAREVLAELEAPVAEGEHLTVQLTPPQMKITHSAVRLLLNDSQRDQAAERALMHSVLEKLPDEHVMRAIQLD